MKQKRLSATQTEITLEQGDTFAQEIAAKGWKGRFLLAWHFLRVAWLVLRRGRVTHRIEGGQPTDRLEDILDAEYIGED